MRRSILAATLAIAGLYAQLPLAVSAAAEEACTGTDCASTTAQSGGEGHQCERKKEEPTTS